MAYSNSVSNEASAGFVISNCGDAVLINNTARGNLGGIAITEAENVTLINNTMDGNNFYNFALWGSTDAKNNHSIDTTNLADGKPIYYIKNANNTIYDSTNAAAFYCIWCNNVTIKNLNVSRQAFGVYMWTSNNSLVENVDATYTYNLIRLVYSSNNTYNNIKMGVNYDYDFESSIGFSNWTLISGRDSLNNTFNDFNFNGVTIDFVASDVVMRKAPNLAVPSGYKSINKNIEAAAPYALHTPYLFMNISYTNADIEGIDESSLFIARNNGTWELNASAFSNPYGVNSAKNYVYANITDLGSNFVILGKATEQPSGGGGGRGGYIPPICGDGKCDSRRESYLTCPSDCKAPEEAPKNISKDCGDLNARGCGLNLAQGEAVSFIVKNQKHTLQIDGMTENTLTLWIWSDPIKATISVGETKQFDLNKNNYNDFAITLNSITNDKANLVLKSLSEAVPSSTREAPQPRQQPTAKKLAPPFWVIILVMVVIAALIAIVIWRNRESRLRQLGYK